MTSHINREISENFSEPFGQPIGFDAILPVTQLEHDTVDISVVCILLCVGWEGEDRCPGVVEYFGTRMNRNRFRNILGYFGTIPIYPAPSGRIFRNRQDISEPMPFLCDAQYLTVHNR